LLAVIRVLISSGKLNRKVAKNPVYNLANKRSHFMNSMNTSRRQMLLSLPGLMMAPRLFAQAGNPPIRVKGINHVTLHVSDVKRSVDFYQGLFGMPIINRQGTTSAGLQIGAGPQHLGVNSTAGGAPKIDHICFAVDNFNVDRIVSILTQRGFTKSDEIGPMRVRVHMRDPRSGGSKGQDFQSTVCR
jgi:hypothetical protein